MVGCTYCGIGCFVEFGENVPLSTMYEKLLNLSSLDGNRFFFMRIYLQQQIILLRMMEITRRASIIAISSGHITPQRI